MVPTPVSIVDDPQTVVTPLDANSIQNMLHDLNLLDDWSRIVDGLRSRFDSGADPTLLHTLIFPNHASSDLDPSFISSYIAAEQSAGHYSRGFLPSELETIIGPFCTSPVGLVPKPHSVFFSYVTLAKHSLCQ
jgi:hypothetical protein